MEAIREIVLTGKMTKLLAFTVRNTIDPAIENMVWVDNGQTVEIQQHFVGAISQDFHISQNKQNKCKQIPIISILF